MVPDIYDKTGNSKLGELTECLKGVVIEERNGMFEAEIIYSIFSPYWMHLIRGNIFTADANDTLKAQKFRIYKTSKPISGKFSVYARHISFDIARDMIEGLDIENQSCEYCLNQIFRNSQFSRHFKGYSDIVNVQNFKIGATKVIKAIAGESGSIIDTFGNGADILRNNEEFHVLNRRGHDNGVTIEYGKNLTGIDLTEDEDGMITRIRAVAKYYDDDNNEIIVHSNPKYVDSPKVFDYETPFIEEIDFSDKFEDGVIPTPEKLTSLAEKYFRDNKCDIPKTNAKLTFVALSKCVGYEGIQDKLSLCDTVTIKDYRYNFETQAKVIKTYYNFLEEKYEKMEIGDPRTNLGDIITSNGSQVGPPGPAGPPGQNGADGNIEDFPNVLPDIPILEAALFGFASIGLDWSFDNRIYYTYELYASKSKDFTPNTFNLIFSGQASSFLHQVKPNETWYYKVCCLNTHGNRTEFSNQVVVTTKKVDDLSNYVDSAAIDDALIGTLNLDRGWVGQLKGNWIDAKQLSVTDGNGKRTLWIDSYGNVNLDVTELKINNENANNLYATKSSLTQESDKIVAKFENSGGYNLIENSTGYNKCANGWSNSSGSTTKLKAGSSTNSKLASGYYIYLDRAGETGTGANAGVSRRFKLKPNTKYTISGMVLTHASSLGIKFMVRTSNSVEYTERDDKKTYDTTYTVFNGYSGAWSKKTLTFTTGASVKSGIVYFEHLGYNSSDTSGVKNQVFWADLCLVEGDVALPWTPHPNEIYSGTTIVDANGVTVLDGAFTIENNVGKKVFYGDSNGNLTLASTLTGGAVKSTDNTINFDLESGAMNINHSSAKIGQMVKNIITGTSIYGVSTNAEYNNYVSMGAKTSSSASNYSMMLTCAGKDISNFKQGVNLGAKLYCKDNYVYDPYLQWTTDNNRRMYYSSAQGQLRISSWTSEKIALLGSNSSGGNLYGVAYFGYDSGIDIYRAINMHGYGITNSKSISTYDIEIASPIAYARALDDEDAEVNEIKYGVTKTLTPNIEYIGEASIIDGQCIVDLPEGLYFTNYAVILTPIGNKKIWLEAKEDDKFIVNGDDCDFDFIIKAVTPNISLLRTIEDEEIIEETHVIPKNEIITEIPHYERGE